MFNPNSFTMPEIVKKNPVNDPTQKPVKSHSKFTPNFSRYDTHRFGLNTPHFVMAGVTDDDISMRCTADVDTYSLKSPLMQPIKRNMDYFQLSLRALLPHNAELLITNPLHGDDIVAEDVNAILKPADLDSLKSKLCGAILKTDIGTISTSTTFISELINSAFISYMHGALAFSAGSLPQYLGYNLYSRWISELHFVDSSSQNKYFTWDFDTFYQNVFATIDHMLNQLPEGKYLEVRGYYGTIVNASSYSPGTLSLSYGNLGRLYGSEKLPNRTINYSGNKNMTVYDLIDLITESNDYVWIGPNGVTDNDWQTALSGSITTATSASSLQDCFWEYWAANIAGLSGYTKPLFGSIQSLSFASDVENTNVLRLVAYQCASAEFYTSDKVDNVYSSQLYLQNQFALACLTGSVDRYYELNGVPVQYDAFSGVIMRGVLSNCTGPTSGTSTPSNSEYVFYAYWHNLLAFTRSLKYEDYFVGARKQPLAVGDVTVGVDTGTNTVDVIDVTKKIQVQRFLNQVNRIGRKFSDYVKGILGDRPMKDVHEPIFLGHVADTFGAEETDNTGADQLTQPQTTTSKLRNNSSRFGFDVHCGEPSIIIGITNYDIVRVYKSYKDRENIHADRYEMFNPFMQFVGDQAISINELRPYGSSATFGYTMRYMEYKQKVDQCAGGFACGELPGFARILDVDEVPMNINSDFIRSKVEELDQFYISMTGLTIGKRFNFIVRVDNDVTANRPMVFAPSIL